MMRPGRLADKRARGRALAPPLSCSRIVLLSLLCACTSAKGDGQDKDRSASSTQPAAPSRPLDHSIVPTSHLADLETIDLAAQAPCSLTIDSLRPALSGLAELRKSLEAATDTTSAVTLLSDASAALIQQTASLADQGETDELRRLRAELVATLSDLAEGLQKASIAIHADNKSAADANLHRIQNGVANTRSTILALIEQCAIP